MRGRTRRERSERCAVPLPWRHSAFAVLAALACVAFCACASAPREPWVLDTGTGRVQPSRDLQLLTTYPQVLATTLDIMRRDLRLPPVQARLAFLPDDATFEALLREIGYSPALARETAQVMTAIGGNRTILINQGRLERDGWPRRVALIAHELTHVLQYELGGGQRGTSAQWLREGFAEWVALRVMETLDRLAGHEVRRHAIQRLRAHGGADRVPPLVALGRFPDWVAQSRGPAGHVLYDLALVSVWALLDRHGPEAVVRYFTLFSARQDRAANFLEAFGEPEARFDAALRQSVWPARRKRSPAPRAARRRSPRAADRRPR